MFSGIIEEIGTIRELSVSGQAASISITAAGILKRLKTGDSVAVNGVCLTVSSFSGNGFKSDLSQETLEKSNLCRLKPGDKCNLESAIRAGEPLGGHFVSGHIDGTGEIAAAAGNPGSFVMKVRVNAKLMKYIADKGSVAIDGISLTPFDCTESGFSAAIIPHTKNMTTLHEKKAGDEVNIECDILCKYIERLMDFRNTGSAGKKESKIDTEFLRQRGFLI